MIYFAPMIDDIKKSWAYGLSELCQHNGAHDAKFERLLAMYFPLMIDYINLWLTLAISARGNFHTPRKVTSL